MEDLYLQDLVGSSNFSEPILTPERPVTRVARVQVIISLVLGLTAFLVFSVLRLKYPKIYVANFNHPNQTYLHSFSRQRLPRLPPSLFGWIPVVFKINDNQILEHAGLDAAVFLGFFKMCIRLLTLCVLIAILIISPIRYKLTGKIDRDDPKLLSYVDIMKHKEEKMRQFHWVYIIFTYVFTFITIYFLFHQTTEVIKMRQVYLGKQNSITDRTVKISGIPPLLRDEEDLKRCIHGLGIGEVESIVIVKEWSELNKLFQLRNRVLRKTELQWVKYFESNGVKKKNDTFASNLHQQLGDLFNMNSGYRDDPHEEIEHENHLLAPQVTDDSDSPPSLTNEFSPGIDDSVGELPLLNDELARRPKIKTGILGIFGKKVDALNYYSEKLEFIDKEIRRARQRDFPATSTAFITLKSVAQAQTLAQAVLDPKVHHLVTTSAPAPHDIIWDNLCLSRKERNLRIFLVTLLIGLLSVALIFPVSYLAQLLNIKSISKLWPSLGEFLKNNKLAANLVTTLLPTYLFTILNIVMPFLYVWISSKQGFTSHSDEELSGVSKNFFYIFVNLFLVFTMAGTASLSDTTKIAYQLAQSLRDLSLFYVDLIILQGLGIFPYKLLLLGNLIRFSFGSMVFCKTPRDYLHLMKPPVFNFGLQLPQPILILIITIVYSVMSTKIVSAGLIYFVIGYFVFKYQLLYACVHPPHSTGKVWPLVFRRVILGLLIFQLTMAGTLALQKAYVFTSSLAPLSLITIACLWNFQKNYIPLSTFIALRSIDNNQFHFGFVASSNNHETVNHESINEPVNDTITTDYRTVDEVRESHTTYEYPHLLDTLEGPLIAIDGGNLLMFDSRGMTVKKSKITG